MSVDEAKRLSGRGRLAAENSLIIQQRSGFGPAALLQPVVLSARPFRRPSRTGEF